MQTTVTPASQSQICHAPSRLRTLQPVNPFNRTEQRSMSSALAVGGMQVVPVEPYLRWDADVSRRFLKSIGRVEIHETLERNGTNYFVVDVFLTLPTSRLPIPSDSESPASSDDAQGEDKLGQIPPTDQTPTYQIERRYSAFDRLRSQVDMWLHEALPLCRCPYCIEFIQYLRFTWTQPGLLTKIMYRGEDRKQLLATFMNDLVKLALRPVDTSDPRHRTCKVQAHVPSLLESFLLDKSHQ